MQRSRGVTAAVRTTVGTAVVHTRLPGRTTVGGPLGTAIRTTVVHTGLPSRTTIGRPLGTAIRTTVVHTGLPSRTTVSGPLGPTVRTTVVHARHSGRSAVGGALVLVRVLVGNHRCSSGSTSGARRPVDEPGHGSPAARGQFDHAHPGFDRLHPVASPGGRPPPPPT
ncbi:hypothetical protein [Streptomyces sp. BH055]|uniref:hypothetical protein n=1 Tax=Streptomyces sp. BH055 TaxID=3401173 RepID=UPI003BB7534B